MITDNVYQAPTTLSIIQERIMAMQTETRIKLHAQGPLFNDGMELEKTLAILQDFNRLYSYCIKRYQKKYAKDKIFFSEPQINISCIKKGLFAFII